MGKLTYQVASGQEASLSVITLPTYSGVWGSPPPQVDPDTGAPDSTRVGGTDRNVTMTGLHYSGVFLNHRLRVSAHLGSSHQQLSAESSPQGLREGGARYQGVAQASWWMELAGHHELKAGVDGDLVALERSVEGRYASRLLGGFVQDSWMPFNRLTVNAGVRYESQWLYGEDDQLAFALAHQLFPRVGLVLDPFATSHMKLFAHYGKYHAQVPLALMPSAEIRYSGARQAQAYNPAVLPPPSTELVAGAEFELLDPDTRLSAHYTHRQLAPALEGNPEEERTLDAVTVVLSSHNRWQGWQAQASYTWAHLYGNYVGPFREGEMEFPSDFDLSSLMENRTGLLPYDRTHTFKAFGSKEFNLSQELSASVGLVYRGSSGRPISYRGAHVDAGVGESFILPRGMAGRTDWHNVIDSRVGVSYRLNQDSTVSFTLDVFNLFNFQAATGVDEDFTYKAVLPIKSGTVADLTPDAEGNIEKLRVLTDEGTRAFNVEADMNRNFGRPTQYQAPRQMRVGLRYTF
jgi:outer membrane receptor protein involved in Fe transport